MAPGMVSSNNTTTTWRFFIHLDTYQVLYDAMHTYMLFQCHIYTRISDLPKHETIARRHYNSSTRRLFPFYVHLLMPHTFYSTSACMPSYCLPHSLLQVASHSLLQPNYLLVLVCIQHPSSSTRCRWNRSVQPNPECGGPETVCKYNHTTNFFPSTSHSTTTCMLFYCHMPHMFSSTAA